MKKLISLLFLIVFGFPFCVSAETLNLNNPETVPNVPANTSQRVDWTVTIRKNVCVMETIWFDANNRQVGQPRIFQCFNHKDGNGVQLLNSDCTADGVPYECCTANTQGVCECFEDTFGFTIRTQDAGTKIGVGLRTLLFTQWKRWNLSAGNDGTFQ